MVWIFERRATDSLHKTCGNDTILPSKQKKNSQGSIGLHNTPKACKSEQDSQQKITFYICSAHVLFPNITSIKRQMQRQEKTGRFHVNSKKEWNNVFDGVHHRVQSNRQITQDIRQWHKSSIEARKISHKEALDLTTRQIPVNRKKNPNKNSPSIYVQPMCYSQTPHA